MTTERLRSHYESLARVIRFVRVADTKAAPVLAFQIALGGALAARSDKLLNIVELSGREGAVLCFLIVAYCVIGIAVVVLAALVYIPINPKTETSLIYFEDIASMDYERFRSKARDMTDEVIECDLLDQIHRVSKIASVKMCRVRRAFQLSLLASLLWIVLLAWGVTG